ncbi:MULTISPECIES: hypothetical protein [Roseomonadaceae]|uniref:Uncharacterized protein n=1 Tax=Falsiroseomonas oleicola TaxID=2801474 RepID=A0ABS6H6J4_9PROT|nr:hypothetical protein [Roseomonas oleicola]MBU8544314.1 hypothetical protein [Roseomonas oleicola]
MSELSHITVFRHGRDDFLAMLAKAEIPFERPLPRPGAVYASAETVAITVALAPFVTKIIVEWIKARASRFVQIRLADGTSVEVKGLPTATAIDALGQALAAGGRNVTMADTRPE